MRVAIYNQMFGLNGKSFVSNILGHWAVHFQSNPKQIFKRINLERTIEIVKKSNADIIGICEVLEGQHEQFRKMLNEIGYKWVYFGKGHKLSHHDTHVIEIIASKFPCKQIDVGNWMVENKLGGGGGLGAIYIPKLKSYVFNVHLALSTRKYFYDQIKFIAEKIKKLKGKVILVGDFNLGYEKIKDYFPELQLVSDGNKTCSLTPIMKHFFWIDCDHIFVRGWNKKGLGELKGYSDHKLIYADLD